MLQFLELFWSFYILRDIVNETNRYVTLCNRNGIILGDMDWELFMIAEFKAWLAIWLYMGMKRQSSMKSYWMKEGFGIPLPHYFKSYVMEPLQHFDKMFFILQILQHMRVKRVCQDITS